MNVYKYEIERLEGFEKFLKRFDIVVEDRVLLFNSLCTDSRCYELQLPRTSALAVVGDKILDFWVLVNEEKTLERNYNTYTKEVINSFRCLTENDKLIEVMNDSKISQFVMQANNESIVPKHYATCFEAIIFVIYDQCGIKAVKNLLKGISFSK